MDIYHYNLSRLYQDNKLVPPEVRPNNDLCSTFIALAKLSNDSGINRYESLRSARNRYYKVYFAPLPYGGGRTIINSASGTKGIEFLGYIFSRRKFFIKQLYSRIIVTPPPAPRRKMTIPTLDVNSSALRMPSGEK